MTPMIPLHQIPAEVRSREIRKIPYVQITVHGTAPKLEGWTFLGTLDHYSVPGSIIVNTVPGHTIPQSYYNSEPVCDHCQKIRRRKETFIVQNEKDGMKQIGRQCLKDFLGHVDPSMVARFFTAVRKFVEDFRDEEQWSRGGYTVPEYKLNDVLLASACVIRMNGWVSKSNMEDDYDSKEPTASIVGDLLNPDDRFRHPVRKEFLNQFVFNDDDQKTVDNALVWLSNQDCSNEYMHNIKTIADSGWVTDKMLGYACSIIASYFRQVDREKNAKYDFSKSEYVGEKNQRLDMNVTVISSRIIDSSYSQTELFRMLDNSGNLIIWFCSGSTELEIDGVYKIKATIKDHEEYNGVKQTKVLRVKIVN